MLQLVVTGRATERAAEDWTDVEGWEVSSCLRSIEGALAVADDLCLPYLELLRARA